MTNYYDLAAANERVAQLRPLLARLKADRAAIAESQARLEQLRGANGNGRADLERVQQEMIAVVKRMEAAVRQIDDWGVTLRDIGSGLVDFPALVSGRPIWLCWKLGEGDIGWWHDLEAGLAGRKPLIELE